MHVLHVLRHEDGTTASIAGGRRHSFHSKTEQPRSISFDSTRYAFSQSLVAQQEEETAFRLQSSAIIATYRPAVGIRLKTELRGPSRQGARACVVLLPPINPRPPLPSPAIHIHCLPPFPVRVIGESPSMAAPPVDRALRLGFRFEPKPRDVVRFFLPRLIAGEPLHASIRPFIHAADIYACEPGVLAAQFRPTPKSAERFFFTTCKLQPHKTGKCARAVRAAGPGSWHSQGNTTDIKDAAGVKIGELKKLRYKKDGKFTDWLMDELSSSIAGGGDRQYVLCKIYVSPRAAPDSAARRESDAFAFTSSAPPPEEEPVVVAPNNKRQAAPLVVEPPSAKRTRSAVVPTAPVVQPPPAPLPSAGSCVSDSSMVLQAAPTPRPHKPHHQPSVQTSKAVVALAPCSYAASRDPFESPAAAQDDDDDFDFANSLEGSLEEAEERDPFARLMMCP